MRDPFHWGASFFIVAQTRARPILAQQRARADTHDVSVFKLVAHLCALGHRAPGQQSKVFGSTGPRGLAGAAGGNGRTNANDVLTAKRAPANGFTRLTSATNNFDGQRRCLPAAKLTNWPRCWLFGHRASMMDPVAAARERPGPRGPTRVQGAPVAPQRDPSEWPGGADWRPAGSQRVAGRARAS